MKRIPVFILCLCLSSNLSAQNNSVEAKAAYLMAEEAFEGGKFAACVNYLEDATKKLGATNSKILYLKVLAEAELSKTNAQYFSKALNSIQAFQQSSDVATFNEEKVLEIAKLKIKLTEERIKAEQRENALRRFDSLFPSIAVDSWRFGMSYPEARALDDDFFRKARRDISGTAVTFKGKLLEENTYGTASKLREAIYKADFKDEKLTGLHKRWLYQHDDISFSNTKKLTDSLLKQLRFRVTPTVSKTSWDLYSHWTADKTTSTYNLKNKGRKISLVVTTIKKSWKQKEHEYHSEIDLILSEEN